jgi:Type II secretory pathway, ATPase PulE/Tfp pilus assembly pathway, ATPase PilB
MKTVPPVESLKHVVTPRPPRYLGEILVQRGIVTEQQVQQGLEVQSRSHAFIGQILVDLGFASARAVGELLGRRFGVPYVDLLKVQPTPQALELVPEEVIRATQALPLRVSGASIEVAMTDPLDVASIDRIHNITGLRVVPSLTMAGELLRTLNELFDASTRTSAALDDLAAEISDEERAQLTRAEIDAATTAPVVRLVDSIIESALASRASDIHFEPQERGLRVRFRVDGTLMEHTDIPRSQMPAVLARLKVLCIMDITESRRPQDGRMRYDKHGRTFDFRVSSVPTVFGEKLVLRILDKASVLVPLAKLGFLPDQQHKFESLIRQPHGMVIVVGPTGSGKSTTLYSSLNLLNDSKRNIMTLEDPVEYNVAGLNQIQVNTRIGLTFASGLRTFVRQDPDVILVGEIRDRETAEMAVQASLTGHLLLSTLHTNSAVGTVSRLANLGLDSFLIAQALTGVVSQRLVAKVCENCAVRYHPDVELLNAVNIAPHEAAEIHFRRGQGCRSCHGRGYLGRMAVYEVLVLDSHIRRLIMSSVSEDELQIAAERSGMMSLRDSVLHAVKAGITTPEEMGRVVLTKEA